MSVLYLVRFLKFSASKNGVRGRSRSSVCVLLTHLLSVLCLDINAAACEPPPVSIKVIG